MSRYHQPVLLSEVISIFDPVNGKNIIDATVGGGGHASELVKRGAKVLGIDADRDALAETEKILNGLDQRKWKLAHGNFRNLYRIAKEAGFIGSDGILFDLGMSSYQIDNPDKGFSYRDGQTILDMRYDKSTGRTAADLLAEANLEELYEIFSTYGEEKHSRAIALAIVSTRSLNRITYSDQLIGIIAGCCKPGEFTGTTARIYQALRIAVNDELNSLKEGLDQAGKVLKSGGKLAIISFHSLEDRIVKLRFRHSQILKEITKKPIIAGINERNANPRSRSAKLRIAEKK